MLHYHSEVAPGADSEVARAVQMSFLGKNDAWPAG